MIPSSAPPAIRHWLTNALPKFAQFNELVGVAAGGSFITNTMDDCSDLDLVLAISSSKYAAFMAEAKAFCASFGQLLTCFTGEHVGEPRLVICFYNDPLLHVDFKMVDIADFHKRVEDPVILWQRDQQLTQALSQSKAYFPVPSYQWWEDRFWAWILYLAQKLKRGEYFECLDGLAFLRMATLGPMIQVRHHQQPRGVRNVERVAPELLAKLKETHSLYQPTDLLRAIRSCIDLYLELRNDGPSDLNYRREMRQAAETYLNQLG